jgi:hypothetical protein
MFLMTAALAVVLLCCAVFVPSWLLPPSEFCWMQKPSTDPPSLPDLQHKFATSVYLWHWCCLL